MRAAVVALTIAAAAVCVGVSAQPINRDLYVPTPIGYMLASCVHRVPSNAHVSHERDAHGTRTGRVIVRNGDTGSVVRIVPKCNATPETPMLYHGTRPDRITNGGRSLLQFPPDYDGWEAYTVAYYAGGFDVMTNNFNTPDSLPVDTPDVLYLFPGLQNVNWIPKVDPLPSGDFDIIQPVLQYPGDNGNYWSVKSWYVTLNAGYLVSDEIVLNPGDNIFGNQTRLDAQTYYVGSTAPNGQTTSITAQAAWLASQPWAYCTLECYGCDSCASYPVKSPSTYTQIELYSKGTLVTPQWQVTPKPPQQLFCKEKAVIDSPQAVHINFGNE